MALQYPDHSFISEGLYRIAAVDLKHYKAKVTFIERDAKFDGMETATEHHIRANLVKPDIRDAARARRQIRLSPCTRRRKSQPTRAPLSSFSLVVAFFPRPSPRCYFICRRLVCATSIP